MKFASIFLLAGLLIISPVDCSEGVVQRLCETVKKRKQLLVDKEQTELIWSDGAMFEIATKFPTAVDAFLSTATTQRNLKPVIARMTADLGTGWKDAKIGRSEKGDEYRTVQSSDRNLTLTASAAYIDYLKERYPKARVLIKGELQAIIFVTDNKICGAVMPIRGTPPAP